MNIKRKIGMNVDVKSPKMGLWVWAASLMPHLCPEALWLKTVAGSPPHPGLWRLCHLPMAARPEKCEDQGNRNWQEGCNIWLVSGSWRATGMQVVINHWALASVCLVILKWPALKETSCGFRNLGRCASWAAYLLFRMGIPRWRQHGRHRFQNTAYRCAYV
jgi:hypothetical protein